MPDRPQAPDPDHIDDDVSPESDVPPAESEPRRVELTATPRRTEPPTTPQKSRAADVDVNQTTPVAGPPLPQSPPSASPLPPVTSAASAADQGPGDRQWRWPLISLAGLVAVVLVNWLAIWLPLNGQTTGEVSRANPVPFQPAGWAFLIWSLIYGLLLAFVIYSFLPAGRHSSRIRAIGPLFLVANIANIAWIIAWHWEQFTLSLIAIVILLGSLAIIYGMLRKRDDRGSRGSLVQRFLIGGTFSIYLGWVSIATLANVEVWMDNGGWNGGPFSLHGWTVIFLIGGLLVASAFAILARDAAYPLVFGWGYAAIAREQWGDSALISILAGILAVGAVALAVMAALLAFDSRRESTSPLGMRLRRQRVAPVSSASSQETP